VTPATYALCALRCLTAARLPARVDVSGKLKSLVEQDRSRVGSKASARGPETFGAFGVRHRTHRPFIPRLNTWRIPTGKRSFRYTPCLWRADASCGAQPRHRGCSARGIRAGGLMRSAQSSTAIALLDIRFTRLRFAGLSFAAAASIPPANTFGQRSIWRATRWRGDSSNSA
jgi:hypothetical protein